AVRFAERWQRLLAAAVAWPDGRLKELPLLSETESAQLLEWRYGPPNPATDTVPQLFAAQAARTPEAAAVEALGATLSYGELASRAGRLARRLRELGVGAEARVGLCVERSSQLPVGMLSIWQAGGAYVPLD